LDEEGRDKVVPVLLIDVSKIKIEITHRGLFGLANNFDALNNCGTIDYIRIFDKT
jgi:hypothetical protein